MAPQALSGVLELLRSGMRAGAAGEELACRFLRADGLEVLVRNFRCRSGEVDVIARDGDTTVFVEVKQRRDVSRGFGHEAVTPAKRRRIVRAARLYAARAGLSDSPLRFAVVSIDWSPEGPRVRHDRGAFDADGR